LEVVCVSGANIPGFMRASKSTGIGSQKEPACWKSGAMNGQP
jgi:hypothetical protein